MAKQLKSYKDLSIRWDNNRQRFILEARAIGGGQLPFATKSEAVAEAKQLFERWRDGTPVAVEDEWTLDTAAEKYIAMSGHRVLDENERYGPCHYQGQTKQLNYVCDMKLDGLRLGKMKVRNLDTDLLVDHFWPMLKKQLDSDITAMNYYVTFKQMLNLCVTRKQLPSNVARDATLKSLEPRVVFPSKKLRSAEKLREDVHKVEPDTIQRIVDAIPTMKNKLIVYTASQTGLRAGELCVVKLYKKTQHNLGGIDFEGNCIWVELAKKRGAKASEDFVGKPKSESGVRRVPITRDLSLRLEEYWMALSVKEKSEGYLFPTRDGTRSDPTNWRNRILYPACERAGLNKDERPTWHMLRHCYATALLSTQGSDWVKCMERMGHADMSTTMMYKHVVVNAEEEQTESEEVQDYYSTKLDQQQEVPKTNVVPLKKAS